MPILVTYPIVDGNEAELAIGDSVFWGDAVYTIVEIEAYVGTTGRVLLSNGSYVWSYGAIKQEES